VCSSPECDIPETAFEFIPNDDWRTALQFTIKGGFPFGMNNRGRKGALLVSVGTLRLDDGAVMFLRQSCFRWKRLWERNQIRLFWNISVVSRQIISRSYASQRRTLGWCSVEICCAVLRNDNVSSYIVVKVDVVLVRVAVKEIVIYCRCSRGYFTLA